MSALTFSLKTFHAGRGTVELVKCSLVGEIDRDEFLGEIRKQVLPELSGDDTVLIRGDSVPEGLLEALIYEIGRKKDYSVMARYDLEHGCYIVIDSAGDEELGDVIPDPEG